MISSDQAVPRIVLDTNVCLDLFLFHDPACATLLAALQAGQVRAVTRADCREEWLRVLHYPQLPIDADLRPGLVGAFDALIELLPCAQPPPDDVTVLPRCGDPDDQKFLELALLAGARWLLSKDKELLKLDRRTDQTGLFRILLPLAWSAVAI
ncbi:MAG: PIN domain-containing protein [Rhodanobacter sp.]